MFGLGLGTGKGIGLGPSQHERECERMLIGINDGDNNAERVSFRAPTSTRGMARSRVEGNG